MSLEEIMKKMQRWSFSKYCSNCGEVFESNDVDEFIKMVEEHFKTCKNREPQSEGLLL